MAPVETPDDFGCRHTDGRAIDDDGRAQVDHDHGRRRDQDRRFGCKQGQHESRDNRATKVKETRTYSIRFHRCGLGSRAPCRSGRSAGCTGSVTGTGTRRGDKEILSIKQQKR